MQFVYISFTSLIRMKFNVAIDGSETLQWFYMLLMFVYANLFCSIVMYALNYLS